MSVPERAPRIYLTHHVDLDIEIGMQNGPGPADRLVYDEALLKEAQRLVGDDAVEVAKLVNRGKNTFRFSGAVGALENVINRYDIQQPQGR